MLARNDRAAAYLHAFAASPTGVSFELSIRMRERFDRRGMRPDIFQHRTLIDESGNLPDSLFRLGVIFPDGRCASTLDSLRHARSAAPAGPVLSFHHGGGGGGRRWDQTLWLWPLPNAGSLTFVCEWPAFGFDETRVEVDASPLIKAASAAIELWPDLRPEWKPPASR